jgi:hypothetical protein
MATIYDLGIHLGMTENVTSVLSIITRDVLGLAMNVEKLNAAFEKFGAGLKFFLGGAASATAGVELVKTMADMVKYGEDLIHVQQQLATAGVGQLDVAQATSVAWQESAKYGLKVADVLKDIKEARLVFGSTEHAINFIDPLERMRVVLNSVTEGKGDSARDAVYEMARAGELKGLNNPDDYMSYFNQMTKVISASGGKIDPKAFMQVTQYGRLASLGWDEEFYTKYLPTVMQSMGASQSGTALMSLFGTLVQGKATARSVGMMDEIGLIGDRSKLRYDKLGNPVGFDPGAIVGTDELVADPFKWAQDYLLPLVTKKFGDLNNERNKQHFTEEIGGLFGNRTSAQAIAELIIRAPSFKKDLSVINQAQDMNAYKNLLENDPTAVINRFVNAWSNLLTALGSPSVEPALHALNSISNIVDGLTKAAVANPGGVQIVGQALTAIAGAMILLGSAAVVGGAAMLIPGGVIGLAITGLVGVIGALAAANWASVKQITQDIFTFFSKIFVAFQNGFIELTGKVTTAISDFFATTVLTIPNSNRNHPNPDYLPGGKPNPFDSRTWPGYHKSSFTYGDSTDSAAVTIIRTGVYEALRDFANGGPSNAGSSSGNGIINASYTTGSGQSLGLHSGAGFQVLPGLGASNISGDTLMSSLSPAQRDAMINSIIPGIEGHPGTMPGYNNPGNIMYSPWAAKMGATGRGIAGVAIFPTLAQGQAALRETLFGKYGNSSIHDMVYGYLGHGTGGNVDAYTNRIVSGLHDVSGLGGERSASPVDAAQKFLHMTVGLNNPDLMRYMNEAGIPINPRNIAWCAAFVNASLVHSGIQPLMARGSPFGGFDLLAGDFRNWGVGVDPSQAQKGDVMWSPSHVGLVEAVKRDASGRVIGIEMISGNSGGSRASGMSGVTERWTEPGAFGIRRATPDMIAPPLQGINEAPVPLHDGGFHAQVHTHVHLDGKEVSRSVANHMLQATRFPKRSPNHDSYRTYTPADAGFQTA